VEVVFIIAGLAVLLLLAELMLPTGGVLAFIGAAGLVAAGVVALNSDESSAIGAGLITAGVLSIGAFVLVARKVTEAHHDQPVSTGAEGMIGHEAEVRLPLDPVGQVFVDGALWKARADGDGPIAPGNRVRVKSVDGLTLVVEPIAEPDKEKGS
jgi:membrane-bound serine protease (ClpP class)